MSPIEQLLKRLKAQGGELVPNGPNSLRVKAPAPLPPEFMAELRMHKAELLAVMGKRRPYRFALRDGSGTYITMAQTLADAERELMAFYGDRLQLVAPAGGVP